MFQPALQMLLAVSAGSSLFSRYEWASIYKRISGVTVWAAMRAAAAMQQQLKEKTDVCFMPMIRVPTSLPPCLSITCLSITCTILDLICMRPHHWWMGHPPLDCSLCSIYQSPAQYFIWFAGKVRPHHPSLDCSLCNVLWRAMQKPHEGSCLATLVIWHDSTTGVAIPQSRLDTTLGISKGSCKHKDIEHCPTLLESVPQVGSRSREKTLACLLVYCPSKWISQLIAEDLCAVSFARVASISLNSLFKSEQLVHFVVLCNLHNSSTYQHPPPIEVEIPMQPQPLR